MPANPMDWTADPFLTLYTMLALALLGALFWWRRRIGSGRGARVEALDPVQLGYLAGGPARAADTVLVGLLEAGTVMIDPKKGLIADGAAPPSLRDYCGEVPKALNRSRFRRGLSARCADIHADLAARGLMPANAEITNFRTIAVLLILCVAVFGVCKIEIGSARGHPVGILTVLVIATVVLGVLVAMKSPYRTVAGASALAQARRDKSRALRAPLGDELLLAFALTGAAVLAGRPYQTYFQSSSGDGGGDSGGGSGCGGGGCGGCS